MKIASRPPEYARRDNLFIFDHFDHIITADRWTTLVADTTPTVSVIDSRGGILQLTTDATDNNEVAVSTTHEMFLLASGRPMWGSSYLQFTEANTDDANIFFGFANAIAANMLVDDGAGMRTSGSIAAIYKVDGGTVWRCHTRDNGGATDTVSTTTAGGTDYQELEIEAVEYSTLECEVVFKVDGNYLRDSDGHVISHRMAYASLTEMDFGLYAKAGGANDETLLCDWIAAAQRLY